MFLRALFIIGLCAALSLQAETEVKKPQETVSSKRETTEQNDIKDFEDSTELSDEEQVVPAVPAAPETGTLLHYMFDLLDCDEDYDLDSVLDEYIDDDGNSSGSSGGTGCRRPCSRIYKPLCVSINGVPTTMPSPCEYQNRLRCAKRAKRNGRKYPKIRYLYNGECRRNRNKRSLISMLTD